MMCYSIVGIAQLEKLWESVSIKATYFVMQAFNVNCCLSEKVIWLIIKIWFAEVSDLMRTLLRVNICYKTLSENTAIYFFKQTFLIWWKASLFQSTTAPSCAIFIPNISCWRRRKQLISVLDSTTRCKSGVANSWQNFFFIHRAQIWNIHVNYTNLLAKQQHES